MSAPALCSPDLPGQFARLTPDGQLRLRSMFVGVIVAAAAFDLLISVRKACGSATHFKGADCMD
jgi:hypothetical protein